jgi:Fe-S cluster biogenesis protein NfuA
MPPQDSRPDLREQVARILVEEIAPALHLDAREITVLDVKDGVAQVRLGSACAGCPGTIMTLIMGLQQELRQRIPEVQYLEAVP